MAIHLAAGLLLFGLVRRTLSLPQFRVRGNKAVWLAGAAGLLWTLHPLHTASVTYIIQRAESLVGMLLLLTVYCCARGMHSARRSLAWYAAGVVGCALGMLSKESMAVAPLIVLLYDRTFISNSFRAALRQRRGLYSALGATWGLIAAMIFLTLSDTAQGFGADSLTYLMTQPGVILYYLWLSVWPSPLLADYAWPAAGALKAVMCGAAIAFLLYLTIWALRRHSWAGFLGAWFFLTLAPSSSFVVLLQNVQLQRMYLPLAAVVVLIVTGVWYGLRRLRIGREGVGATPVVLCVAAAATLGWLTYDRNARYHDATSFWQENVDRCAESYRAWTSLGISFSEEKRFDEAIGAFGKAVALTDRSALALQNLAVAYRKAGRLSDSVACCNEGIAKAPKDPELRYNLAEALAERGDYAEAATHYRRAVELKPTHANAWEKLAAVCVKSGQLQEAVEPLKKLIELSALDPQGYYNLGAVLLKLGRTEEGCRLLQQALTLKGGDQPQVHGVLGLAMARQKRFDEAVVHLQRAIELRPDYVEARDHLAAIWVLQGRLAEAAAQYERVVDLQPDSPAAMNNLAWLLASREALAGRSARAVELASRACRLTSNSNATLLDTLGVTLAADGQFDKAVVAAQQALKLAQASGQGQEAQAIQARLKLYQAGKPYRQK
ncbi:MAG: tetratricopeptide repeat protein [Planctomycetaceae bacterium]|nr:tetratricopeptide repeat protein [Planctomycetaceae bacterium]